MNLRYFGELFDKRISNEKGVFLLENPFLEEKKVEPKKEITESQKKRNFKGLELFKEALKKVGAKIKDYKGVN